MEALLCQPQHNETQQESNGDSYLDDHMVGPRVDLGLQLQLLGQPRGQCVRVALNLLDLGRAVGAARLDAVVDREVEGVTAADPEREGLGRGY